MFIYTRLPLRADRWAQMQVAKGIAAAVAFALNSYKLNCLGLSDSAYLVVGSQADPSYQGKLHTAGRVTLTNPKDRATTLV